MKPYLISILSKALEKVAGEPLDVSIIIENPRDVSHGDAATNLAMTLSGRLKKAPRKIAEELIDALEYDSNKISGIEIAGPGFINFRFAKDWLFNELAQIIKTGHDYGKTDSNKGKRVLVEFVSANPTGPLTVGHGRNAVLGDTICRLLEWTGAEVQREYYFNNAGRQMRLLGQSVHTRYVQQHGVECELPDGGYEGEYIRDIAAKLTNLHGTGLLDKKSTDSIFKEAAESAIFNDIKTTLSRMQIEMDSFFNEHTLYESGSIDRVVEKLRAIGLAYDADGAVWFKTTTFGKDKDTVLIKSTGEPTYRLPDIAYHIDKLERGFDLCIDIFGADHIATYPDIVSAVNALGYDASKIDVQVYQFVSIVKDGVPFKMSTRKANFVTLDELMDEVGSDVTRFFFLMRTPGTHLEFDIAEAKEAGEKNPVYYLQYAHARIKSILRKAGEEYPEVLDDIANLSKLNHDTEIGLIKLLFQFPDFTENATKHREPHRLIGYLNDVASQFHKFYHDCRILGEPAEIASARAQLLKAVVTVMANGLTILGISAPDKM